MKDFGWDNIVEQATPAVDVSPTLPAIVFEAGVLLGSAVMMAVFSRFTPKFWQKFFVMAAGILVFELFTAPLWDNSHLGRWGYIYLDVSWILTVGWTSLLLGVVLLIDRLLPQWRQWRRFLLYIGVLVVPVILLEMLVVGIGVRTYAPELVDPALAISTSGVRFMGVPIEVAYYVPVFTTFVIAFYKYWAIFIDEVPLVPSKQIHWLRGLGLAAIAVLLFEIMVEPMVVNQNLPAWTYLWGDLNWLLLLSWVTILAVAAVVVQRLMFDWPIPVKFAAALGVIYCLALPLESWLIRAGFREYGPSATENFVGIITPLTGVNLEIAFAVPCYFALMIAFIRFWEITLDNRL